MISHYTELSSCISTCINTCKHTCRSSCVREHPLPLPLCTEHRIIILSVCKYLLHMSEIDPPPFGTQYSGFFLDICSTQGVSTQYAEILFYPTQTSIFTLKRSNFYQETQTRDIQSQITLKQIARSLLSRFFGVISAFINFNIDLGRSKSRVFNKQTHQS